MKTPGFQLVASLIAMVMTANVQYAWTLFVGPIRAARGWQQSDSSTREFDESLSARLILFGESGRRAFLVEIGPCLDELKVDLVHRQDWQALHQSV